MAHTTASLYENCDVCPGTRSLVLLVMVRTCGTVVWDGVADCSSVYQLRPTGMKEESAPLFFYFLIWERIEVVFGWSFHSLKVEQSCFSRAELPGVPEGVCHEAVSAM